MSHSTEPQLDLDSLARTYALRHFNIDDGVERIYHLPARPDTREIRFVEVNNLIPETPPEPLDYGVDIHSPNAHTLYVLDITPKQWKAIQEGEVNLLPPGVEYRRHRTL